MFFNASVESLPHYLEDTIKNSFSRKEYKTTKRKFDGVVAALKKVWPAKADAVQNILFGTIGTISANIKIDKFGVLRDLREYADNLGYEMLESGEIAEGTKPFAHLLNIGDSDGLVLPFRFSTPVSLDLPGRNYAFPVSSGPVLRDELKELNKHLEVERTFRLSTLPEFIEAKEEQIEQFEKMYDVDPSFWCKFGYTVLVTLNNSALKNKLPIIFHYLTN